MKIALLTGEYPPQPGGVGDYTRCLGMALQASGHTLTVLTIQDGALLAYAMNDSVTRVAHEAGLDWSPRVWPVLLGALERIRPDWMHIQYQTGAYAMAPGVNLLPWRLRRRVERPRLAVTFHDLLTPYLFPKAGPLRSWVNQRLASDADIAVATNPADLAGLRTLLRRGAPPPQLIPIGSNIPLAPPPGYDRAAWRATLGAAPGELLVAYFGLLSPSKGVDVLLTALAGLARPWRLVLIGGAATAPQDVAHADLLQRRIGELAIAERVVSTGHVSEATVSAHLLAADCVALPYRDGASYRRGSLLAALAHGCPVVTTLPADQATADDLAGAALLVAPDQPQALTTALARLADEPGLGHDLGIAARLIAERFSWEAIALQHEHLYGRS